MCSCIARCCRWLTSLCWRPDPFDERNIRISEAIEALSEIIKSSNEKLDEAIQLSETLKGMMNVSEDSYSPEQKEAAAKMGRVTNAAGLLQLTDPPEEEIPSPGSWCFLRNRPIAFDPKNRENIKTNLRIMKAVTALSKTINHFTKIVSDATEDQENYTKLYYQQKVDSKIEKTLLDKLGAIINRSSFPFLPYTGPVCQSDGSIIRKQGKVPESIKLHKEAIEKALEDLKFTNGRNSLINSSWQNPENRKRLCGAAIGELVREKVMTQEQLEKAFAYLAKDLYEDLEAVEIIR